MPKADTVQASALIKPTVGRVVLFHPSSNESDSTFAPAEICAAVIARVFSDEMVNLAVFDADGKSHSFTSVPLVQGDAQPPEGGRWCEWMPFQKGQAARTDQVSSQLESRVAALEKEHPKHSASRQVSVGDIVVARKPGMPDAPAIVVNVVAQGIDVQLFRGDHGAHAMHTLEEIDPATGKIGWFWPSELEPS